MDHDTTVLGAVQKQNRRMGPVSNCFQWISASRFLLIKISIELNVQYNVIIPLKKYGLICRGTAHLSFSVALVTDTGAQYF